MGWLKDMQFNLPVPPFLGGMVRNVSGYFNQGTTVSDAGANVDHNTALTNSTVFRCVSLIASNVASLGLQVFKHNRKEGTSAPDRGHHLYPILRQAPNEYMNVYQWVVTKMLHMLTTGNAYSYIERDKSLRVTGLYPLSAVRMRVWIDPTSLETFFEYHPPRGGLVYFKRNEILHWYDLSTDGITGVNRIEYARNTIGRSLGQEQYESSLLSNGGVPHGVITYANVMSEEGMKKVRESWQATHGGAHRAGNIAILDAGLKYEQTGLSNVDMEWIAQRQMGTRDICKFYGVFPEMIGDGQGFVNEDMIRIFRQLTLRPICEAVEQCLENDLLLFSDRKNNFIEFNLDAIDRASLDSRSANYARALQWGWMSRNEIRTKENMEPLDPKIGDQYLQPLNMVPADKAEDMAKQKIASGQKPGSGAFSAPGEDPATAPNTEVKPGSEQNQPGESTKRAKNAAKRALNEAISRVFVKESRKIEQLQKNLLKTGGAAEFERALTDFYKEQRSVFAEMILPATLIAVELQREVTPTTEIRCKAFAERLTDRLIDASIMELRQSMASGDISLEMKRAEAAQIIDQGVSELFESEEAA